HMVIDQHHSNHVSSLSAHHGSMMPAAAALAINQAQLCNECNKIAIHFILQAASLLASFARPGH
ncbi:hypothetical protein L4N02_29900, partial [Klebsiella variicola]|uniref:hypothetical protein n=1 Tax=Klebsiella variicola TaxID=244366 RepID=UPI001F218AFE